ncbi:hypothetical protein CERSUDRAFT_122145 [Gelatoporia subvermispora B]|uniref:Uncharacterized protein n=1 Tax=Ceriporiopsis subvermispora (strain B) TaxID=914234 RepID=M2RMH0_CERS8|nr:hypothetical protein CERSUDRAFT_122145 [Gelatoporia subvermispora B]
MSPPIEFQPQFGVEFEMVVKNIWAQFQCLGTEESKVFAIMAKRTAKATAQAVRSVFEKDPSESLVGHQPFLKLGGNHWTIVQDASIREFSKVSEGERHSPKSQRDRTALELVSPVIPWDSTGRELLEDVVNFFRNTWRPVTNDTTGFHVHIGNAAVPLGDMPFTLEQIKQFAKMCVLFEEVIDEFHPPDRAGRGLEDSEYTLSNVANSFFATCRTNLDRVEKIEKHVRGTQGIIDCMNRTSDKQGDTGSKKRYYKVNFASLDKHGSIEFRQHQGELGYERIELYISFLVDYVKVSIGLTNDDIEQLARNPVTLDVLLKDVIKNEKYRKLVWKEHMKSVSAPSKDEDRVASNKEQRKQRQKQQKAHVQNKPGGLPAAQTTGDVDGSQGAGSSMLEPAAERETGEKEAIPLKVHRQLAKTHGRGGDCSRVTRPGPGVCCLICGPRTGVDSAVEEPLIYIILRPNPCPSHLCGQIINSAHFHVQIAHTSNNQPSAGCQ